MELLRGERRQSACGHDPGDHQRGARNAYWAHTLRLPQPSRLLWPVFRFRELANVVVHEPQPFTTPSRCSSVTSPNAVCWNLISVPPSSSLSRYCTFDATGYDMNSGP